MTTDDPPETDDPSLYRGDDAVRVELAKALTDPLLIREVQFITVNRARGTTFKGEDLFNTIVKLLLEGRRRWRKDEAFADFVSRTAHRLVQDWWRRQEIAEIIPASQLSDRDADRYAATSIADPAADRVAMAREELRQLIDALKDEKHTAEIAEYIAVGESAAEIRRAFGLDRTAYASALKRIARARKKIRPQGGNQ